MGRQALPKMNEEANTQMLLSLHIAVNQCKNIDEINGLERLFTQLRSRGLVTEKTRAAISDQIGAAKARV